MKKSNKYLIIRAGWYLAGLALFFAPLAILQRVLISVFKVTGSNDTHGACFRMALQGIAKGNGFNLLTTTGILTSVILISAVLAGPIFCGRFCIAGAVSEYLSRIVPERFKVNWQKYINPTPIRYGVLAGFLIVPFFSLSVACAFCNFSFLQGFITGGINWTLPIWGSTAILTIFIWLIVLGAFAKGGRGYCSYLCPVGASQSLLHNIGARFGFTFKIKFAEERCVSCNLCVKDCPMGSLQSSDKKLTYNINSCITCHQCVAVCPKNAITYGRGKSNWNKDFNNKVEIPKVTVLGGE